AALIARGRIGLAAISQKSRHAGHSPSPLSDRSPRSIPCLKPTGIARSLAPADPRVNASGAPIEGWHEQNRHV
ncbi:MAG: hypothetical protein AAF650_08020, partial [Pseudomonadota bacterium]